MQHSICGTGSVLWSHCRPKYSTLIVAFVEHVVHSSLFYIKVMRKFCPVCCCVLLCVSTHLTRIRSAWTLSQSLLTCQLTDQFFVWHDADLEWSAWRFLSYAAFWTCCCAWLQMHTLEKVLCSFVLCSSVFHFHVLCWSRPPYMALKRHHEGKVFFDIIKTIAVVEKSLCLHTSIWMRWGSVSIKNLYRIFPSCICLKGRCILRFAAYMQWWPLAKVTILISRQCVLTHLKKNVF